MTEGGGETAQRRKRKVLWGRDMPFLVGFVWLTLLMQTTVVTAVDKNNIDDVARLLSEKLVEIFTKTTFSKQIPTMYEPYMMSEQFDPRAELKKSKEIIEKYLEKRERDAYEAKISLESRELSELNDTDVNNRLSKNFIRFMSAKQGTDATTIYTHDHTQRKEYVNASRIFNFTVNANFYQLPTSSIASAVHIPTPLYDRDPILLQKIDWSNIDAFYRAKREETRDLAFQMFCSESGYMRYYPAASWYWDNAEEQLDLFDCRNTEWYINGATCSKNMIIMLDMSGSMLGQRYEIAKQTTEAILETLSHNDYFNILSFSKSAEFLDDCKGSKGLLQATMRNKKMLRERMDNLTSEGKAEYEKALQLAFETLYKIISVYDPMNSWQEKPNQSLFTELLLQTKAYEIAFLPDTVEWTTREDLLLHPRNFTDDEPIFLDEHVLIVPRGYRDLIADSSKDQPQAGCESVIMLITDGAPQNYEETFRTFNAEKNVRFFSFLIGEEAIDFDQVKWMACNNRGYMVHVANMADVEEKVQHYIRVMSRSIGKNADNIKEGDAVWSGVYRERLYLPRPEKFAEPVPITNHSYHVMNMMAARKKIRIRRQEGRGRMFVTTVSYPVSIDGTFMGVAAVNIPLTEISQLAAPMMIGARSYYFMLDQNGFVMFHPQLRPIDIATKYHKSNYNNMDLLELEVPQSSQIGKMILTCNNADPQQMDMLFASEILDRIYPQTNTYYTECVGDSNDFIIGLAVAKGDDHRVKAKRDFDYSDIDVDWVNGSYWKVHPHWRYCLLNDTDTDITKEDGFIVYIKFMKAIKGLPEMCKPRKRLVERIMWDFKATAPLDKHWQLHEEHMQKHQAHVIFFTSPTGMIRYHNVTLKEFEYTDPTFRLDRFLQITEDVVEEKYQHFIAETNRKSVDDRYYRRAIRNDGMIVFDVNYFSKLWYKEETESPFGFKENVSMLFSAYQTIYLDKAILGVVGMEMGYDALVKILANHGCTVTNNTRWCVLLDEHGYVFYSNMAGVVNYAKFYEDAGDDHLGKWFGNISRVSQRAMELLVKKQFYRRYTYVDHQATCKVQPKVTSAASIAENWIRSIIRLLLSTVLRLLKQFEAFTAFSIVHEWISPIEAYTTSFHDMRESFSCSKVSPFYFANRNLKTRPKSTELVDGNKSERPCPSKCSVKMNAAFIEGTNLIMVWIIQDTSSSNCYDSTQCPMEYPGEVPFGFNRASNSTRTGFDASAEEMCKVSEPRRTKVKNRCYKIDEKDEAGMPCSHGAKLSLTFLMMTVLLKYLL